MSENRRHGGSRLSDRTEISNRQENNENDYSQGSNYYSDDFDSNQGRSQQGRNRGNMSDYDSNQGNYGQSSRYGQQDRNEWEESNRRHQNRGGWGTQSDRQPYSSEFDNWSSDRRQGTNYGMGRPQQSRSDYNQSGSYGNNNYDRRQNQGREDYGSHYGNDMYGSQYSQDRWNEDRWNQGSPYNSNRDTQYGSGSFGQGSSPYSSNFGQRSQMDRNYGSQMDRGYNSQMERNYGSQMGNDYGSQRNSSSQGNWGEQGQHKGKGPKGYQRSDERITEDINDRLTDDPHIDASQIEVKVTNGEVKLSGTVTDRNAKRHAEDLAEAISGVSNVENSIRVQSENSRSEDSNTSSRSGSTASSSKSANTNAASGTQDHNGDKSKRVAHQHN